MAIKWLPVPPHPPANLIKGHQREATQPKKRNRAGEPSRKRSKVLSHDQYRTVFELPSYRIARTGDELEPHFVKIPKGATVPEGYQSLVRYSQPRAGQRRYHYIRCSDPFELPGVVLLDGSVVTLHSKDFHLGMNQEED